LARSESAGNRVIPILAVAPQPDASAKQEWVSLYSSGEKIYPRSVYGRFAKWRWLVVLLTQAVFYGLPWIEWGQRQIVLFDLGARRFYIFGLVLYPQDFIYLTGLLIISAFSLFLFTAVAGRLWCGYACPQTVYTEIFLWIERHTEGDRSARMRLDAGPFTTNRILRKGLKHLAWLVLALWTGFTFVGYFTPIRDLYAEVVALNLGSWEVFWMGFYGLATYGNAGFMREQVCKHMCPYARFQSAMFDKDTLIVTYDANRGEPRGARSRKADLATLNLGACVDCTLCVQVCPTGIDIRNGLQYECIGCAACVDVCDTVMDKMGYARGLVKYTTENAMKHGWSGARLAMRILRPRVLVYSAILGAIAVGTLLSLAQRLPFKVDVVRDRSVMARVVSGGLVENVYRLQIMNATEQAQRYRISAVGLPGLVVATESEVEVAATASRWMVVRLRLPGAGLSQGSHPVTFELVSTATGASLTEESVFFIPN
jgi:cytochrome c oxidase accessory protein FixG